MNQMPVEAIQKLFGAEPTDVMNLSAANFGHLMVRQDYTFDDLYWDFIFFVEDYGLLVFLIMAAIFTAPVWVTLVIMTSPIWVPLAVIGAIYGVFTYSIALIMSLI